MHMVARQFQHVLLGAIVAAGLWLPATQGTCRCACAAAPPEQAEQAERKTLSFVLDPAAATADSAGSRADSAGEEAAPATDPPAAPATDPSGLDPFEASPDVSAEQQLKAISAAMAAPADAAPAPAGKAQVVPLAFFGIRPGEATFSDVERAWGAPAEVVQHEKTRVASYRFEGFARVDLEEEDDQVRALVVRLATPIEAIAAAEAFGLKAIRAVDIPDASGRVAGRVFPERGVLFSFTGADRAAQVDHVVLEAASPESFLLRAETGPRRFFEERLRDIETALELDDGTARGHWLRAETLLEIGRADQGTAAAARAVALAGDAPEYRLTWARGLARTDHIAAAQTQVERALGATDVAPVVRARGLALLGELAQRDGAHDCKESVERHMQAVRLADSLALEQNTATRRDARNVLVQSYLALGRDIAWGEWQKKAEVVPLWLDKAWELAETTTKASAGAGQRLRLRVSEKALLALTGVQPATDPWPWVQRAQAAAKTLRAGSDDQLLSHWIHWNLGKVYYYAMQLEHVRGKTSLALEYGRRAIDELDLVGDAPVVDADDGSLVGWVCFQIGAVHAVHRQDHDTAVRWFEKAAPTLIQTAPLVALFAPTRQGDALISMGVSYWEIGQKEKAIELTQLGADLLEEAVQRGVADRAALAVPYGNLATMHEAIGAADEARRFAEMAGQAVRR